MRSFVYFIKEAFSNARKNFSTTFGGVVTIFLSLLVIGVFMVLTLTIGQIIGEIEKQVSITIFLHDNATETDIAAFTDFLVKTGEVSGENVVRVSKEEALEKLKDRVSSDIVGELDGNPLPASLEINLKNPKKIQEVLDQIMTNDRFLAIIDEPASPSKSVKAGDDLPGKIFSITNAIRVVSATLVALLVFVALIFINNTIRLSVLARRKEIAIMKLVGASNAFIRGPFLMEGLLQALIGAGLAIFVIALASKYLLGDLSTTIPWLGVYFGDLNLWLVYIVLLGAGVLIGLFGSIWALRRYLKV